MKRKIWESILNNLALCYYHNTKRKKEGVKHCSHSSAFKTEVSLEKAILTRLISNCVKIMKQKFFAIVLLYP